MTLHDDSPSTSAGPFAPDHDFALALDAHDELAPFRHHFVFAEPDLIYLDGNSLGRLPKAAIQRARHAIEEEWGRDLIRSWNRGWWDAPLRVGDAIGELIGAAPGQVIVSDTTSINLYKLALAALSLRPERKHILTDTLNFPSDAYILQGIANLLSPSPLHGQSLGSDPGYTVQYLGSDDGITPNLDQLTTAITDQTALVTLSHVVFKSGYLYDMRAITELAHRKGALVLWDLSHSVGVIPMALDDWQVDFAIGCTYKYLNGGPGSPAFLYVNRRLQDWVTSPIWGWWGQRAPFDFELDYLPAPGIRRFLVGTQPILSLLTLEAALEPIRQAGIERIRRKAICLTEYAAYLTEHLLTPFGFSLASPRDPARRGAHISLRHPEAYRITRALIEEMRLIPDFRAPDNIRLGFAPLYVSFSDVWQAFDRIRTVMLKKRYQAYPHARLTVT